MKLLKNPFGCSFCTLSFESGNILKEHVESDHLKEAENSPKSVLKRNKTLRSPKTSGIEKNPSQNQNTSTNLSCSFCTLTFKQTFKLHSHENIHVDKKHKYEKDESKMVHFCRFCNEDCIGPENLKIHEKSHKKSHQIKHHENLITSIQEPERILRSVGKRAKKDEKFVELEKNENSSSDHEISSSKGTPNKNTKTAGKRKSKRYRQQKQSKKPNIDEAITEKSEINEANIKKETNLPEVDILPKMP